MFFVGQLHWTFDDIDNAEPVRFFRLLFKLLDYFKEIGKTGGGGIS